MPHYSFSQSQDSLPIRELNNEFLKGIEAREKLHILKDVVKLDSIQLSLYKDSIVPSMQKTIDKSREEISRLDWELYDTKQILGIFKYTSAILSVLVIGLIL
jgi:hypothetical protein